MNRYKWGQQQHQAGVKVCRFSMQLNYVLPVQTIQKLSCNPTCLKELKSESQNEHAYDHCSTIHNTQDVQKT